MKRLFPALLLIGSVAFAEEIPEKEMTPPDIQTVSESFGHLINKNLDSLGMDFDLNLVIKGIQDAIAGKKAPMDENTTVQAITQLQEAQFQVQADDNLAKAEEFLAKNSLRDEIVEVEEGRLQYKLEQEGTGALVEEGFSPTIRYVGKFLDGSTFGESQQDEVINLGETIAGFSKSIVGMKEGEKRTVYIHPEFGYGSTGYLPPNSLLTFEITVVKADTPQEMDESLASAEDESEMGEIASTLE